MTPGTNTIEAIEDWLEGWTLDPDTFDPKGFDFKDPFYKMRVTQAHAPKLKTYYVDALVDFDLKIRKISRRICN